MAKAINWPSQYLNDVINENATDVKVALRLGTIYYDHCYYTPDEIVDVRVNHKIVRQARVVGEMKVCKISELTPDDLNKQKPGLNDVNAVVDYLSRTYNQQVSPDTIITVVYYRNLSTETASGKIDDPHM